MKCLIATSVSLFFIATLALAHGNEQHVMGTVTEVNDSSITVETKEHQKLKVSVVAETKFAKGTSDVTLKDVKVGDRVVIHAVKQGEQLQAHTVRIGSAFAAADRHHSTQ
jgi:thymidine phosphorylase